MTLLAVGDNQTKAGPPVRAVDADSGDTLTYSISDADAGSGHASLFTIDSSTGQILRKVGDQQRRVSGEGVGVGWHGHGDG